MNTIKFIQKSNIVSIESAILVAQRNKINSIKDSFDYAESVLNNSMDREELHITSRKMWNLYLSCKDDYNFVDLLNVGNKNLMDYHREVSKLSLRALDLMNELSKKGIEVVMRKVDNRRSNYTKTTVAGRSIIANANVRIEKVGKFYQEGFVDVTYGDGTNETIFSFYPDELHFNNNEFIGLTRSEALKLRTDKDIAYLKS